MSFVFFTLVVLEPRSFLKLEYSTEMEEMIWKGSLRGLSVVMRE